jgi:hypothetical protein
LWSFYSKLLLLLGSLLETVKRIMFYNRFIIISNSFFILIVDCLSSVLLCLGSTRLLSIMDWC